ncbi:MAG: hypothetical protein QM778_00350 [Myxococcales bacterium]
MAKKAVAFSGDRTDPKQNKSLAIRMVVKALPKAAGKEIVDEVKKQFGHSVSIHQIYMVKSKTNVKRGRRKATAAATAAGKPAPSNSAAPASWVDAIKHARQLLASAGSYETATAILKAIQA